MAGSARSNMHRTSRRWGRGLGGYLRVLVRDDDDVDGALSSPDSVSLGDESDSDVDSPSPTTTTFRPPPPPLATTTTAELAPSGALGAAAPSISTTSTSTTSTFTTSSSNTSPSTTSTSTSATSMSTSTFTSATSLAAPSISAGTGSIFFVSATLSTVVIPAAQTSGGGTFLSVPTVPPTPSGVDSSSNPDAQDSGTKAVSPPPEQSQLGTNAGIALGSIAGIALIVSLGFCVYKLRKRRRTVSDEGAAAFNKEPAAGVRPWTTLTTGTAWLGLRKKEARSESRIIDEMIRAAYDAEDGGANNTAGLNGYLDEKNAAANGFYAPTTSNPAGTPRIAELASYDLRTPLPAQALHDSFLDRPPTAFWPDRRSVAEVATGTTTTAWPLPAFLSGGGGGGGGDGGRDPVSPETPRSSGALSWFRKDPAKRLEAERRRMRNVEAAHMRLVGQRAGSGLDTTLHSRVPAGGGFAPAPRSEFAVSVAATEATEGTWNTWGLDKRPQVPKMKKWLEKCLEKGGIK